MDAPVISPVGGYGQLGGTRTRLYNNPPFDYLSGMLPQDIKQLFQWCELISVTMPHLGSADTDMHRNAVQKQAALNVRGKFVQHGRAVGVLVLLAHSVGQLVVGNGHVLNRRPSGHHVSMDSASPTFSPSRDPLFL